MTIRNILYKVHILGLGGLIMGATSCTSNDELLAGHRDDSGAGSSIILTAEITGAKTQFVDDDKIGVMTSYTDINTQNREYKYDGTAFTTSSGVPFYVKGNCRVMGYYPFTGIDSAEPTLSINTTNQSDIKPFYMATLDGVTINSKSVHLCFRPLLTTVIIKISIPQGEQITDWRLSGVRQSATISPNSFDLTLAAEAKDLTGKGNGFTTITLQLIPQIANATLILTGKKRSYTIDLTDITFISGETMNVNINANDGTKTIELVQDNAIWEETK